MSLACQHFLLSILCFDLKPLFQGSHMKLWAVLSHLVYRYLNNSQNQYMTLSGITPVLFFAWGFFVCFIKKKVNGTSLSGEVTQICYKTLRETLYSICLYMYPLSIVFFSHPVKATQTCLLCWLALSHTQLHSSRTRACKEVLCSVSQLWQQQSKQVLNWFDTHTCTHTQINIPGELE